VVTHSEPVSMSRETTFDRDLHAVRDRAELTRIFTELATQVATDLQRKGYAGRTIGIKLRFDDFKTVTRDMTLPQAGGRCRAIRHAAGLCLNAWT
jgi:DNA polymerase-4